jgi:hypothetical protein
MILFKFTSRNAKELLTIRKTKFSCGAFLSYFYTAAAPLMFCDMLEVRKHEE